jgi:ketosteroid isomerase-like protein
MLMISKERFGFTRDFVRGGIAAACVALVMLAAGCGKEEPKDTRVADEAAIKSADTQWAKTAASKDVDATIAFYSDDASLLPPNAPMASDKASIRAAWAGMLGPGASLSWQATKVEAARSGDLGYVMGTYQLESKDASGKEQSDRGKFVEVWKKQADGSWKAAVDIFNSDLPVVAAKPEPAAKKKAARHHHTKKRRRTS